MTVMKGHIESFEVAIALVLLEVQVEDMKPEVNHLFTASSGHNLPAGNRKAGYQYGKDAERDISHCWRVAVPSP